MVTTVSLLAPLATAYAQFETANGVTYTADNAGLIYNIPVLGGDYKNLTDNGWTIATNTFAVRAGGGAGIGSLINESGNIARWISGPGVGNNADTTDDVLSVFALPAGLFDQANRILQLTAGGKFANNGNNKQFKLWMGPTLQVAGAALNAASMVNILASGVVTTAGGGWSANVQVTKYGATGSNTQLAALQESVSGSTHLGTAAPVPTTLNEAIVQYVALTGASGTTGAASDVVAQLFYATFFN